MHSFHTYEVPTLKPDECGVMSNEDLTVAILAGGASKRFKTDKYAALFQDKPLLAHMMEKAYQLSTNVLIVASTEAQAKSIKELFKNSKVVTDPEGSERAALVGAITAFEYSETKYTLLLPVDTPLVRVRLLQTLVDLAPGHGAVVPSWPTGYIEPLHSVYLTEHAYSNGLRVVEKGRHRMKNLLDSLTNVMYVSTLVLQEMDPSLVSFENINTIGDLRRLEKKSLKRN